MAKSQGKLNTKELKEFRDILLRRRGLLVGDVNHQQENALNKSVAQSSGNLSRIPYHMADVGTDNFDQEFTLGLIENEEEELREIDKALRRIEDGKYGTCEMCGKPMPKTRLKVIPYARLCIECKRTEEDGRLV